MQDVRRDYLIWLVINNEEQYLFQMKCIYFVSWVRFHRNLLFVIGAVIAGYVLYADEVPHWYLEAMPFLPLVSKSILALAALVALLWGIFSSRWMKWTPWEYIP